MNDFMCWLYDHYIHPYIQAQPMDDGDAFRRSLLDCGITPEQRQDVEAVLRRYACQGFLLGMRTGAGLGKCLE